MTKLMIEVSTVIVGVIVAVITVVGLLDLRNCSGSTSDSELTQQIPRARATHIRGTEASHLTNASAVAIAP